MDAETLKDQYSRYVVSGGDGDTNFSARARRLGYSEDFLTKCGLLKNNFQRTRSDEQDMASSSSSSTCDENASLLSLLFQASCGSGCPLRLAERDEFPRAGDTVIDLGCGAGHDVLLASRIVGPKGTVVGVDMTPEMIHAARRNVGMYNKKKNHDIAAPAEVIFVCSDLENVLSGTGKEDEATVKESTADCVISNGVINLCLDKRKAFETAFRLLKPGGRFLLSDVCQVETNPEAEVIVSNGDCCST